VDKIKVKEVIVVEGKYDKIALEPLVDGIIIPTDGFGIFNDKEKQRMLRRLADGRGIVILTDSDGAGFVIRNFLQGCIPADKIKNAYIPQIAGKEKRKSAPSKEGIMGVEGMSPEILSEALHRAGVSVSESSEESVQITREMFYDDGYIGGENSSFKRAVLLKELELPHYLSTNALLRIINLVCDLDRYREITEKVSSVCES